MAGLLLYVVVLKTTSIKINLVVECGIRHVTLMKYVSQENTTMSKALSIPARNVPRVCPLRKRHVGLVQVCLKVLFSELNCIIIQVFPLLEQSHYLTAWQNFLKSNLKCIFMHCLCSPDGRQGHGAWVGYGSRSHYRLLWRPSRYIWSSRQTLEGRWTVWCQAAKSQVWQLSEEMEKVIGIFNSGFDNNAKICMYA